MPNASSVVSRHKEWNVERKEGNHCVFFNLLLIAKLHSTSGTYMATGFSRKSFNTKHASLLNSPFTRIKVEVTKLLQSSKSWNWTYGHWFEPSITVYDICFAHQMSFKIVTEEMQRRSNHVQHCWSYGLWDNNQSHLILRFVQSKRDCASLVRSLHSSSQDHPSKQREIVCFFKPLKPIKPIKPLLPLKPHKPLKSVTTQTYTYTYTIYHITYTMHHK